MVLYDLLEFVHLTPKRLISESEKQALVQAKENVASINVLKKLGMVYLKDDLCAHDPAEVYIFSDEL